MRAPGRAPHLHIEKRAQGGRIHAVSECGCTEKDRCHHSKQCSEPTIPWSQASKNQCVPPVRRHELSPVQGKTKKRGKPYGRQHLQLDAGERDVPVRMKLQRGEDRLIHQGMTGETQQESRDEHIGKVAPELRSIRSGKCEIHSGEHHAQPPGGIRQGPT